MAIAMAAGDISIVDLNNEEIEYFTNLNAYRILYMPDNQRVVVSTLSGNLQIISVYTGLIERSLNSNLGYSPIIKYLSDTTFLSAGYDQQIVWSIKNQELVTSFEVGSLYGTPAIAMLPDGQHALAAFTDNEILYVDLFAPEVIDVFAENIDEPRFLELSPDGRYFALVSFNGDLIIWDVEQRQLLKQYDVNDLSQTELIKFLIMVNI